VVEMAGRALGLGEAVEHALRFGEAIGAYQVEAYAYRIKQVTLRVMKTVPAVSTSFTSGLSIRAATRENVGFAYTTSLRPNLVEDAVKKALENARAKGRDEHFRSLPPPVEAKPLEAPVDESITGLAKEDLLEYYGAMRDVVEGSGKRVALVGGLMRGMDTSFILANSLGLEYERRRAIFMASAYGLALDEVPPAEGWDYLITDRLDEFSPEAMGEKVVEEVCSFKRAREVELKGDLDVIFRPEALSDMLWLLTEAVKAENVDRGATPFGRERLGEQVASESLTILDDPRSSENPARGPRDMEGVPTREVTVIERGMLEAYLTDYYHALKWGVEPTGSCLRMPDRAPFVDHWFLRLEGPEEHMEELVEEVGRGFLIRDVMGIHQSDFRSGRFSIPASGWLVEGGEIRKPVRRIMMSGSLPDLLMKADAISKERKRLFGLTRGSFPALRARGIHLVATRSPLSHRIAMRIASLLARLGIIKVV